MFFDSHLHIIDPRFPLVANQGYTPEPFTVSDYLSATTELNLVGGAVVSGSFQAIDQSYLEAALTDLGPGFVGVTQLPATVSDAEIMRLNGIGVRALRFNLKRGGSEEVGQLDRLSRRVHELAGWHVELYVDAAQLDDLSSTLVALPAVSIDHLGLSQAGLPTLLRLAEQGVRVKATGFSRGDLDVPQAIRSICAANPHALMFGTDLPGTRAPQPWSAADCELIAEAVPAHVDAVMAGNAAAFYRIGAQPA